MKKGFMNTIRKNTIAPFIFGAFLTLYSFLNYGFSFGKEKISKYRPGVEVINGKILATDRRIKHFIFGEKNSENLENWVKNDFKKIMDSYKTKQTKYYVHNLMAHNFTKKSTSRNPYTKTLTNFKRDLEFLYNNNYQNIRLVDLIKGNFSEVNYGRKVYTFSADDSGIGNQVNIFYENGIVKIDPNCMIGILLEFSKDHPDFKPYVTLAVDKNGQLPWGLKPREVPIVFDLLIKNGIDIQPHTVNHANLKHATLETVRREYGGMIKYIQENTTKHIEDWILFHPWGLRPPKSVEDEIRKNGLKYQGKTYKIIGAMVANPRLNASTINEYLTPTDPFNIQRGNWTDYNIQTILNQDSQYVKPTPVALPLLVNSKPKSPASIFPDYSGFYEHNLLIKAKLEEEEELYKLMENDVGTKNLKKR